MAEGRLKWLPADRGFGFIAPDEGGRQVFFHASAVEGRPLEERREGQRVEKEQGIDPRNPSRERAERVRVLAE